MLTSERMHFRLSPQQRLNGTRVRMAHGFEKTIIERKSHGRI